MESSVSLRVKINIINFRLTCRTPVLNFLESAPHKFTNTVRIRVSLAYLPRKSMILNSSVNHLSFLMSTWRTANAASATSESRQRNEVSSKTSQGNEVSSEISQRDKVSSETSLRNEVPSETSLRNEVSSETSLINDVPIETSRRNKIASETGQGDQVSPETSQRNEVNLKPVKAKFWQGSFNRLGPNSIGHARNDSMNAR